MDQLSERPPYVTFEMRAEEDRAATIEANHVVFKDVAYALITPPGSKDQIERVADEWFVSIREAVARKRFQLQWLKHYEAVYEAWKKNEEIPVNGIPLSQWPGITKAQHESCKRANILTCEDLAAANEEAIRAIGMGARALQQRAAAFVETRKAGGNSEELAALRVENSDLRKTVEDLNSSMKVLQAQIATILPQAPAHQKPEPKKVEFTL